MRRDPRWSIRGKGDDLVHGQGLSNHAFDVKMRIYQAPVTIVDGD